MAKLKQEKWREEAERVRIFLDPDPEYLVVWVYPTGDPHKCNGHDCGCTARQFGIGCRHVRIVRELGGVEAAKTIAEGEWDDAIQGATSGRVAQLVEPESEREHDAQRGIDVGVGPGRRALGSREGSEDMVQAGNTGGVPQKNTERRTGMSIARGYGYEPKVEGGGNYLRFTRDGETLRLRLVSDPIVFVEETDWGKKTCAAWIVLHKEIVDGKPIVSCKHFKSGMTVYGPIRNLALEPEWGDPANYDVKITRTGTGKDTKYSVIPVSPSKIKPEEAQMVEDANYDLEALYEGKSGQNGHSGNADDGEPPDPFADD